MTAQSLDGVSAAVTFTPTVFGGTPPVQATCTPASGTPFPIGTSTVNCSARDADQRVASCSFTVRVTDPPRISITRFLAFGDSITEGKTGVCAGSPATVDGRFNLAAFVEALRLVPTVAPAETYPGVLQSLLAARYTTQTMTVVNRGLSGEKAGEAETRDRLRKALEGTGAEVVLLQEGINDLHAHSTDVVRALQRMVQETQGRGAKVLIATLLPERPGGCKAFAEPGLIERTNDGIRAMAAAEGATLVDLYPAIAADLATLLSEDGLHPSVAGYAKIADTFYEAIKQKFEVPGSE